MRTAFMAVFLLSCVFGGNTAFPETNITHNKVMKDSKGRLCDFSDPFSECVIENKMKVMRESAQFISFYAAIAVSTGDMSVCDRSSDPERAEAIAHDFLIISNINHGNVDKLNNPELKKLSAAFRDGTDKGLNDWESVFYHGVTERNRKMLYESIPLLVKEKDFSVYTKDKRSLTSLVDIVIADSMLYGLEEQALRENLKNFDIMTQISYIVYLSKNPLGLLDKADDILKDLTILDTAVSEDSMKGCKLIKNGILREKCRNMIEEKNKAKEKMMITSGKVKAK